MNIQFATLPGPKDSLGRADVVAGLHSIGILCESTSFFKPPCNGAREVPRFQSALFLASSHQSCVSLGFSGYRLLSEKSYMSLMDVQEDLFWYLHRVSVKALKSGSVAHVHVVRCSIWDKLRGRVLASAKCVIWL